MLLWLLTRLTYLAGKPDGVKCILVRMSSWMKEERRHCTAGKESKRWREGEGDASALGGWNLYCEWEDSGVEMEFIWEERRSRSGKKAYVETYWNRFIVQCNYTISINMSMQEEEIPLPRNTTEFAVSANSPQWHVGFFSSWSWSLPNLNPYSVPGCQAWQS